MKKVTFFNIILFLVLQLKVTLAFCQYDTNKKDHYIWFDNIIGYENSGIYNGTLFLEKYKTESNNHHFFLDNKYKLGNLIYDNQPYYNVYLKYDIYEDELIAKLPSFNN